MKKSIFIAIATVASLSPVAFAGMSEQLLGDARRTYYNTACVNLGGNFWEGVLSDEEVTVKVGKRVYSYLGHTSPQFRAQSERNQVVIALKIAQELVQEAKSKGCGR